MELPVVDLLAWSQAILIAGFGAYKGTTAYRRKKNGNGNGKTLCPLSAEGIAVLNNIHGELVAINGRIEVEGKATQAVVRDFGKVIVDHVEKNGVTLTRLEVAVAKIPTK